MQTVEEVEKHVPVREGDYGERVARVEPGGVEYIALKERHGKPIQLFYTWLSPNLEFATIFIGVLAVGIFGLNLWQAALAIILGTALGSITHAVLSSWGPKFGTPMMVISRGAFGFLGNILPAGLNALVASVGWNPFAADYTRYLPPTTDRKMVGFWAGFGVFLSCVVLEMAGAVLVTVPGYDGNGIPTAQLQHAMPDVVYYASLLCIAIGAIAANAINIYSGTMSFVSLGIR